MKQLSRKSLPTINHETNKSAGYLPSRRSFARSTINLTPSYVHCLAILEPFWSKKGVENKRSLVGLAEGRLRFPQTEAGVYKTLGSPFRASVGLPNVTQVVEKSHSHNFSGSILPTA